MEVDAADGAVVLVEAVDEGPHAVVPELVVVVVVGGGGGGWGRRRGREARRGEEEVKRSRPKRRRAAPIDCLRELFSLLSLLSSLLSSSLSSPFSFAGSLLSFPREGTYRRFESTSPDPKGRSNEGERTREVKAFSFLFSLGSMGAPERASDDDDGSDDEDTEKNGS